MIPTAVLVTRGDVDLEPIIDSLPSEWPLVVWDNSRRQNWRVLGRYAALEEVETEFVYVQDDDAICPARGLLEEWTEADQDRILLNVEEGETPWVSWGAIFHRDLPQQALRRYIDAYRFNDDVLWWADVIVTTLTPWRSIDLGVEHLPYYEDEHRMFVQPFHYREQDRVRELARSLN